MVVRRGWHRPCPALTELRPTLAADSDAAATVGAVRVGVLLGRAARLDRRHRAARVLHWRAARAARYNPWVFKKLGQATPRVYKR